MYDIITHQLIFGGEMKLQSHDYGFEGELPEVQETSTIEQSAHLFSILSDGIYTDKILAVVREPASNAYDAHVAAKKKNVAFKIKAPSRMDPTFAVEDEGTGIHPDKVKSIYFTYGKSTKTNDNQSIGALGLGCKSPLAYTKSSFVVKNRFEGTEYSYLFFLNQKGIPTMSTTSIEPAVSPDGLTVEFAVRHHDVDAFHNRIDRFFKYWENKPTIIGTFDNKDIFVSKVEKLIQGTGWFLEKRDRYSDQGTNAIAIQGNVPYPIKVDSIPNISEDLKIIAMNPFVITFDMGSIGFTASRESLSYDEFTNKNLIERLEEVRKEVQKSFEANVFKKGMTDFQFRTNFFNSFKNTKSAFNYTNTNTSQDEWFINLFLNKSSKDFVSYNGKSFSIDELILNEVVFTEDKYLPFDIESLNNRGRSSRIYNQCLTTLSFTCKNATKRSVLFPDVDQYSKSIATETVGIVWSGEWNSQLTVSRQKKITDPFDSALKNNDSSLFDISTKSVLKIDSEIQFVINDTASNGVGRFKALRDFDMFLVNFNHKETNELDVQKTLNQLIDKFGLSGVKVSMLSTHEDKRPTIQTVKVAKNSIKLRSSYFQVGKDVMDIYATKHALKLPYIHMNYVTESVFNMDDLINKDKVFYIVKRRTDKHYFDYVGAVSPSIFTKKYSEPMAAVTHLGFFKDQFIDDNKNPLKKRFDFLVLNEGQIVHLKKKGVNLVSIYSHIKDSITKLETDEGFVSKCNRFSTLNKVEILSDLFNNMNKFKVDFSAGFKGDILNLIAEMKTGKSSVEDELKIFVLKLFQDVADVDLTEVRNLNKQFASKYPMMSLISVSVSLSDFKTIVDYIEQQS